MHDTIQNYDDFIASKRMIDHDSGFDVDDSAINQDLFPFQRLVVKWALRRGRAAVFGGTGTGKTPIQLEWARHVHEHTGEDVLIFAPLAVSAQTKREGEKFGVPVNVCRKQADVKQGINITNYEMLEHFESDKFGAIVLDESSILKGMFGKFRRMITDFASCIDFRLACTATPAPNDTMEIVNHAEFLGIMSEKEILALFFTQDFNATSHKWRLKGHAVKDFWRWLASWARAFRSPKDLGFDDDRFILPPLRIHQHVVETDPLSKGTLFAMEARGLTEEREARRVTIDERVAMAASLVNETDEQWIVWTDLNEESAKATKAVDGAIEIKGSDSIEHKERSILEFVDGSARCIVSKPQMFGFGLNLQNCSNMVYVGMSHSWERYYQSIRRCWRFGQTKPVHVHVITSDMDGAVVANIERKEREAEALFENLVSNMHEHQVESAKRDVADYVEDTATGDGWTLYLGDSVETIRRVKDESIGLTIFSPPFPGMYVYTNDPRDMGNVKDIEEMVNQFRFLIPEMLRITMPGRSCCIHLTQGIAFKHSHGYAGLLDFRGEIIKAMQDARWIYYNEVTISKNPQLKALRTKDQGLLFKTLATDAAKSRMAMADYLLQFRKSGENPEPIKAGMAEHLGKGGNSAGWITNKEWIEWASPVWLTKSDDTPDGICESDVLNAAAGRDADDEKHLCPLQLPVIERAIKLWSNPGDTVYSPFAGIGSEGYQALMLDRRFVGGELKRSYWEAAIKNLRSAENAGGQPTLFD